MGENSPHSGKVIAGRFDVANPILTYASIDGKPLLLGVVYAIPLDPGQHPPPLPGGMNAWHEHNGTVDEESFLPEHSGDLAHSRRNTARNSACVGTVAESGRRKLVGHAERRLSQQQLDALERPRSRFAGVCRSRVPSWRDDLETPESPDADWTRLPPDHGSGGSQSSQSTTSADAAGRSAPEGSRHSCTGAAGRAPVPSQVRRSKS